MNTVEDRIAILKKQDKWIPNSSLIKTPEMIEGIRVSGVINTGVLDAVAQEIKAGMSTLDIDKIVYDYTIAHGAIPAPLNYEGFPKSVCTSINDVVCHGIPRADEILKEGDIINVDVSTIYKGYFSDASRMFMIGEVSPEAKKLVEGTLELLELAASQLKPYDDINTVGRIIEPAAKAMGFSVVRELCGHGVGNEFHEKPDVVHFKSKYEGMIMVPGMVFTIEPMINQGHKNIVMKGDWGVKTRDGKLSAQWEHTFVMTETGLEVLTH